MSDDFVRGKYSYGASQVRVVDDKRSSVFFECKIFNPQGKLKKVISPADIQKKFWKDNEAKRK